MGISSSKSRLGISKTSTKSKPTMSDPAPLGQKLSPPMYVHTPCFPSLATMGTGYGLGHDPIGQDCTLLRGNCSLMRLLETDTIYTKQC